MPPAPPESSPDARTQGGLRRYLSQSRELSTGIVLILPLFVAYQIGVLATGGLRNGVDFITSALFSVFHGNLLGYVAFNAVVVLAFGVMLARMHSKGTFHPRLFPWVVLESTVYALLFGTLVVVVIQSIGLGGLLSAANAAAAGGKTEMGFIDKIVMSAGAGLYEEIVFRLFLMGGLFLLAHRALTLPRWFAAAFAVVASSVIFSAVHHISEPFTMSAFTFRVFAGLGFALIYQARGLAVACYTHAIYDVYVMVFRQ